MTDTNQVSFNTTDNPQWIGYSNGKTYPVYKIMDDSPNVGLTDIEGWVFKCWCTFEKIEKVNTETSK
jgi:hypothetical protein